MASKSGYKGVPQRNTATSKSTTSRPQMAQHKEGKTVNGKEVTTTFKR